jgi:hypothetical protein
MSLDPAQLELEQAIQQAIAQPSSANLHQLLQGLEQVLLGVSQESQLHVAGSILAQLVEIYASRAHSLLEEWEERHNPIQVEPILTTELLHEVLRQTMTLNLDDVLAESFWESPSPNPTESIAGTVEKSNLLEFLAQMNQAQAQQDALSVAHDEDVSAWIQAIARWIEDHPSQEVSLVDLQRSLQRPFIEVWLALLLGGYGLEQRGDFYETASVWVMG